MAGRGSVLAGMLLVALALPGATTQQAGTRQARSTLQVGMWTLWRDKEIRLSADGNTSLCMGGSTECRAMKMPATMRANAERVIASAGGERREVESVQVRGAVTLAAHGESETIAYPVTISARGGVLSIAVTLPVERYVEQVVASESGPADTMESLKALAIVVRSYALHEGHGHAAYDLCDSTHCQLLHWRGASHRAAEAHRATIETAGETLWFHGRRALAYFNKDCGGHSSAMNEVWPKAGAEPYLSARQDPWCSGAGQQWASEMTRTDVAAALGRYGLGPRRWQHLAVAQRAPSGRVMAVRLDGVAIPAEEFRIAVGEALGWNKIPSTWFEVSQSGDRIALHGRGWGHGVGLCQRGAAAMGSKGRHAEEILAQYFPGAEAADEKTGRSWKSFAGEGFVLETLDEADRGFLTEVARARGEAIQCSGLHARGPITVRAFPSTNGFRNATLAPGWVAAFAEGNWIATQPLRTLAARKLLADTLRHEFLHALVEEQAGPAAPLWLREGLVELWSAPDQGAYQRRTPRMSVTQVDAALKHSGSEAQSGAAHGEAAVYAAQMLGRYGRDQVVGWLRSGIPAQVVVDGAHR